MFDEGDAADISDRPDVLGRASGDRGEIGPGRLVGGAGHQRPALSVPLFDEAASVVVLVLA
jgi:hypothetical protein